MQPKYTKEEIDKILNSIPARKGWDFSYMKKRRQTAPWVYEEVVKLYLSGADKVLDIGTGGGEKLIELSEFFAKGVGVDIDPNMVKVAKSKPNSKIKFICDDAKLNAINEKFDLVLNRHAPYDLLAVQSKLKKGGYFITQQVGENNMKNIKQSLGFEIQKTPTISHRSFKSTDLRIIAFMEYDVRYEVLDVESLFFWLNALEMLNSNMDGRRAFQDVNLTNKLMSSGVKDGVFVTNEHRYLVIAEKIA